MVKLKRALYGIIQAAKLWYEKLVSVLIADECVFIKDKDGKRIIIAFHVDDLLILYNCKKMKVDILQYLRDSFTDITVNEGNEQSYLGMVIEQGSGYFAVSMENYEKRLTDEVVADRRVNSPATDVLFEIPDSEPLNKNDSDEYHSLVAKLLFLAKRTRIEILLSVSHLASRVSNPTIDDNRKLDRVVKFLKNHPGRKLHFRSRDKLYLECSADASWAVHDDCIGRSGVIVMLNGCCVGSWTSDLY
jgi:hypothetical protein